MNKATEDFNPTCHHCLKDKYIFVVAGTGFLWSKFYEDVYCYDIAKDKWTELPELNKARCQHNSCVMDNSLYVCGGKNEDARDEASIERLTLDETGTSLEGNWEKL